MKFPPPPPPANQHIYPFIIVAYYAFANCSSCHESHLMNLIKSPGVQSSDSRKTSAGQSGRWEQHLGLFKSSPSELPADRHALTAALIHFSRTLG